MALPQRDALHHTYAEYLTWPEGGHSELIDGTAYVREPPAPSPSHQELVGELYHQLRLALEGKSYRPYIAPFDVRLPKAGEADELIDTVVQPDVLIVCDLSKLDRAWHARRARLDRGSSLPNNCQPTTSLSSCQSTSAPGSWKCGWSIPSTAY